MAGYGTAINHDDIYDVVLVGSGIANCLAALEILNTTNLSVLMLERAKRLNDARNVGNGWFGGSARASISMLIDAGVGDPNKEDKRTQIFLRRMSKYTSSTLKPSKPKLLIKSIKRFENEGINLIEPTVIHLSEDKVIKLGDFLYKEIKARGVVLHKINIESLHNVDGHFEIETNDGLIKGYNVFLGAGRNGANWLNSINHNLKMKYEESSFDLGIRLEFPPQAMRELLSKTSAFRFKFDNLRTTLPSIQGTVETEEAGKLKLANGRTINISRGYNANIGFLKTFESANAQQDLNRLVEIVNVIADDQLLKEPLSKLLAGISVLSPLKEFASLREDLQKLVGLLPRLASTATIYAPEARLNAIRFNLAESGASDIEGLYVVGDMSGHTSNFVQAGSSGIFAAQDLIKRMRS